MDPALSISLIATDTEIIARFAALRGLHSVATLLEITPKRLTAILYGVKDRENYKYFEIPKSGGGSRAISSPPKNLKILQAKLLRVLNLVYRSKPSTHGFVVGKSIVTNATMHTGRRHVVNIDLADYFPTIHIGRVIGALKSKPYSVPHQAATILGQICCTNKGILPQGAPTSPVISNMVCKSLDHQLQKFAQNNQSIYSRYADDITFSSNRRKLPEALGTFNTTGAFIIGGQLEQLITDYGFDVNELKTRHAYPWERQEVTGLTVNEYPNLHRKYIRELRAILHNWDKYGISNAVQKYCAKNGYEYTSSQELVDKFKRHVSGKLSFVKMVRGHNDPVYRRLRTKLYFIDSSVIRKPVNISEVQPSTLRGQAKTKTSWIDLVKKLDPCVYHLQIETRRSGDFSADAFGTAFGYGRDYVATAGHNVGDKRVRLGVPINSSREQLAAVTDCVMHGVDCALLKFDKRTTQKIQSIPTQDRIPEIGEEVAAYGYPSVAFRDTSPVYQVGTVTALPSSYVTNARFIQVSFPSGGGLSGAPLIDRRGYVLGIMVENTYQQASQVLSAQQEQLDAAPNVLYAQVVPIGYLHYLDKRKLLLGKKPYKQDHGLDSI